MKGKLNLGKLNSIFFIAVATIMLVVGAFSSIDTVDVIFYSLIMAEIWIAAIWLERELSKKLGYLAIKPTI